MGLEKGASWGVGANSAIARVVALVAGGAGWVSG